MALAGDHIQVLVGGYELTADSNRISFSDVRDMHDVTVFSDAAHKFIPGQVTSKLEHAGYMDAGAARSHPVLKGVTVDGVVSVLLGQNTTPVVGDPVYTIAALQNAYNTLPEIGKYVPFVARFASKGAYSGLWGTALAVPVSFTTTTNGSALDNGASTPNGGIGALHVLTASASDTYTITVEGSSTGGFGGEQTTVLTFTLNALALGSQRVSVVGTIPRYLRWRAVRSGVVGNTVKIAVSFIRL